MAKEYVLIIDDEEDIIELVSYNLNKEGFKVVGAKSGEEGLEIMRKDRPELVLLDLMLPGMSGLDVCRACKADPQISHIPIVMVSAKGEEIDIVTGLELGADDYIAKPFGIRELLARVRTVLRRKDRKEVSNDKNIKIHELNINVTRHEAFLAGAQLDLTATEFKLLPFLASHPGWVFTRAQIVEGVHGDDYPVTDRSVDVQIVGLRKKLGDFESYIETIRGVGYRFKE